MIIEIKNIPEGQKVQNITFNIAFEKDGEISFENTGINKDNNEPNKNELHPSLETPSFVKETSSEILGPDKQQTKVEHSVNKPEISINREKKDIPPEMQDIEI